MVVDDLVHLLVVPFFVVEVGEFSSFLRDLLKDSSIVIKRVLVILKPSEPNISLEAELVE